MSEHWAVGDLCEVKGKGVGVVQFAGEAAPTGGAGGFFLGIALEHARGRHDGAVYGTRYFTCRDGHGIMTSRLGDVKFMGRVERAHHMPSPGGRPQSVVNHRARSPPPRARSPPRRVRGKYRAGDRVEYYSVTYNEWAPAVVAATHHDGTITLTADGAGPGGVDRDRADPQRIRHVAVKPAALAPAPAPGLQGTGVQFLVGENVKYFFLDEWINATVQRVHSDGAVTLDVKEYADPAKIRRLTSAAPLPARAPGSPPDCPRGHGLIAVRATADRGACALCHAAVRRGNTLYGCLTCRPNYAICERCNGGEGGGAPVEGVPPVSRTRGTSTFGGDGGGARVARNGARPGTGSPGDGAALSRQRSIANRRQAERERAAREKAQQETAELRRAEEADRRELEAVNKRMVVRFMEIAGGDEMMAYRTLQSVDWDLQRAIDHHLEAEQEPEPEPDPSGGYDSYPESDSTDSSRERVARHQAAAEQERCRRELAAVNSELEAVNKRMVVRFMEIAGGDEMMACRTLQSVDWDLQRAIDRHLEAEQEPEPDPSGGYDSYPESDSTDSSRERAARHQAAAEQERRTHQRAAEERRQAEARVERKRAAERQRELDQAAARDLAAAQHERARLAAEEQQAEALAAQRQREANERKQVEDFQRRLQQQQQQQRQQADAAAAQRQREAEERKQAEDRQRRIEQRQQTEAAAARRQREVEERNQVEAELQRAREHAAREQQVADGRGGETAHSDVVVKEHQQGGGQTVREYRDGRREVIFPSGQRQITHRDGTEETVFADGQRQTKYPDGKEVTVFADDGRGRDDGYSHTKEKTTFPDGRTKVLWTNGNIDMNYPDGTKETVLPSGEKQTTFLDGTTEVVTAKGLHIPAVLQPSRSPCSSDYHDCDSRALQAQGGWHWRSVEQLAEHLAEPFRGDTEKVARVLFRWVANNVAYDVKRLRQENSTGLSRGDSQTAETVMRTGLAVCEGYSRLMCALCDAAGVACKYIGGKSGNFRKNGGEPQGHGWNALSFDGGRSWHLCDVCWAAGSVGVSSGGEGSDMLVRMGSDGSTLGRANSGRVFSRSFDKKWWCTAPRHFVELHLPEDRGDQLLERPVSEADWTTMKETTWAPTTFATMNDGDEVLAPFTGVLRRGQRVEFRIFLAEDSPSILKLQWGEEWGETLRSHRDRGGYVHSITVQARNSGTVNANKQGPTRQTSTGTSTHYDGLAQWKVE